MNEIIFLLLGLAGLWIGAEIAIRGALNIANHFKISQLFIGLTVMTIGTDLPELFVVISASIHRLQGTETSGLIIGEAMGTLISQVGLILGIASFFGINLLIKKRLLMRDGFMLIASVVLIFLTGLDGEISRLDGAIFLLVYLFYFITLFREEQLKEKIARAPKMFLGWSIISVIAGFALLAISSQVTIENAMLLSERLGVPQYLIGIMVVGLGTSLPELATVIPAIRKHASGLIVGNLIGSNIFDALATLGISASISGFLVSKEILFFDIPFLLALSIMVVYFFATKQRIAKKEAIILLGFALLYFLIRGVDLLVSI